MEVLNVSGDEERSSRQRIRCASFQPIDLVLTLLLLATAWNASAQCTGCAQYGPSRIWATSTTTALTDASGLAVSARNPGVLWSHNDSGGFPFLYAITSNGVLLAVFDLTADTLADFEDMAIGPGPVAGAPYLYVGDIGVGALGTSNRESVRIFRAAEPEVPLAWANNLQQRSFPQVERFTLVYPDGSYDADAMMVDPLNGDVFIGAKQTGATRIYRASLAGAQDGATIRLELVATSTLGGASGGAISADGNRIVLRNERNARLWFRCPGESVGSALARSPEPIPLVGTAYETNGEAIAFLPDGTGYVTMSDSVEAPALFFLPLNCSPDGPPPATNDPPVAPAPPAPTIIITQPQGAIVEPGSHVQLNVVATGQNLQYQWRRNGAPLGGATTDTLVLPDIQLSQSANYTVVVTGDNGQVVSESATVAVRSLAPEPVILIPPESTYVVRGGSKEISVYANGEEPLSYSWTHNGRPVPFAGPVLLLRKARNGDAGIYRVTVSNAYGSDEAEAEVQVIQGPTVRVSPAKKTARVGSTVVLRAVARGAAPLEYQWRFNYQDLPGETGARLVLSGVDESFAGLYTVTIMNPAGSASAGAQLEIVNPEAKRGRN